MREAASSLAALEQKVAAAEGARRLLGADLDKARARVAAALADTARCRVQARQTQRALGDTQQQLQTRDRDVRSLENSKGVVAKRLERVTAELREQVEMVSKKNAYIRELERALEATRTDQEKVSLEGDSIRRARDRLEAELAAMRRRLEDEQEFAAGERRAAERCKRDLAEYRAHVTRLELRQEAADRHGVVLGRQTAAAVERESDVRNQVKALTQLVEQLKEEVLKREREATAERRQRVACECARAQLLAQGDALQAEGERRAAEAAELRRQLRERDQAARELAEDRDAEGKAKRAALDERDIIGAQLVRRNDEALLLRRKVDLLEQSMLAGSRELTSAQGAVRLLQLEVRKLRWERSLLARNIAGMPRLERELHRAVQDLTRSQHLARALEDELHTPLNIHRWRRLEGSDPPHLQLLAKVRVLQRRVLAKTEQMVAQEARVRETEALYLELRKASARRPADPTTVSLQACRAWRLRPAG
ncbi:hypothetical protein ONE63_005726 [Megalurothrips usitatus]|uniref:Cilia- and flagella-associated protein 58 central coiled coil domain-containing protein n=1 Tax=Megalurothrips usitatus TaxID=439358 RepID=A0AAV7XX48_9NEOP|nr:hypothetical protein ONE63_005726 [Megalurothrips usitatus]